MNTETNTVETILKRGHNQSGINPADCKYVLDAFVALRAGRDAAARDMQERCAQAAENERQNSNHAQQRGDQAGFAELGFEAACEQIAEVIRALPDTPAVIATEGDNG